MPLHQRVVGLVHRPGPEGPLQHRVRDLALRHHHQPRGADVEPLHDALALRHPGGGDPEAGAGQMARAPTARSSRGSGGRRPRPACRPPRCRRRRSTIRTPATVCGTTTGPGRSSSSSTSSIAPGADPVGLGRPRRRRAGPGRGRSGRRSGCGTGRASGRRRRRPAPPPGRRGPARPGFAHRSARRFVRRVCAGGSSAGRPVAGVALAVEADVLDHRQDHDQHRGRGDAHVGDVEDRPVRQLQEVDDVAAQHARARGTAGRSGCRRRRRHSRPRATAQPGGRAAAPAGRRRTPARPTASSGEDVGEALPQAERRAGVADQPQGEQPAEQRDRVAADRARRPR